MAKGLESIPETDPLANPEQRAIIDQVIKEHKDLHGAPMVVLGELQNQIGYVSVPMQRYVARKLRVPLSQIYGVVSFYSFFTMKPRGDHNIRVCLGTACYVKRVEEILNKIKSDLKIDVGEVTEDKKFSLETVRCLGACGLAPVMVIDDETFGAMTTKKVPDIIEQYR